MTEDYIRAEWWMLQVRRPKLASVQLSIQQIEDPTAPPDLWIMGACEYATTEDGGPGEATGIVIDPILSDVDALVALTHEAAHAIVGHEADHSDAFWRVYDELANEWIEHNQPGSFRGALYSQTADQEVETV